MKFSEISKLLTNSCNQTITIDNHLIKNKLSERSICHRLAVYLEQNISGFYIDCEYNGDINAENGRKFINYLDSRSKKLNSKEDPGTEEDEYKVKRRSKNIYPDIIIHRRNNEQDCNLLAIEVKKSNNYNKKAIIWDDIKISSYTSPENDNHYNFVYGAIIKFIVGENPEYKITWYKGGKIFIERPELAIEKLL